MSVTPVALLKAHLNLEHDLDDDLLQLYLNAAEAYVAKYIGGEIPEIPEPVVDADGFLLVKADPDPVPDIRLAVLMLAGFWYENREAAQSSGKTAMVPFGVHDLLDSHRRWVV
ncbi:head-tail connector protein [Celeribacter sp.]|uniref:head-tail connector protein n=1 Tax=Celeribacter sp. TaxID=1890673 RepID=UPI003A8E42BC